VHSNGQTVDARYTGVVPDTFKDDAEVVLKGTLAQDGFTVARDGVMAKCPSKYEPKAGAPSTGPR
jgi:cytochrome c-type biogenesis protein CcmE